MDLMSIIILISFLGGLGFMLTSYYWMNETEKEMIPSLIFKYEKLASKYKNTSVVFGLFFVLLILIKIILTS